MKCLVNSTIIHKDWRTLRDIPTYMVLVRFMLVIPIFSLLSQKKWVWGFTCYAFVLAMDFFDGVVQVKWGLNIPRYDRDSDTLAVTAAVLGLLKADLIKWRQLIPVFVAEAVLIPSALGIMPIPYLHFGNIFLFLIVVNWILVLTIPRAIFALGEADYIPYPGLRKNGRIWLAGVLLLSNIVVLVVKFHRFEQWWSAWPGDS